MQALSFYIFYAIAWPLSLLPFRVIYILSDLSYFVLYYCVRYRRKVVYNNLRNSFPKKSEKELISIAKGFYHHLCDLGFECIKSISMSNAEFDKRFVFKNLSLLENLLKKNKNVIFVTGHYGNWEWMIPIPDKIKPHRVKVVYMPLKNPYFNNFVNSLRARFNPDLVSMKEIYRQTISSIKKGESFISYFLADQATKNSEYWTTFLNQDTAFFGGAEKIARKTNQAVTYLHIAKVKRGYYEAYFSLLCEEVANCEENEVTEKYVRKLESIIQDKPEYWLWSHRRWKYRRQL